MKNKKVSIITITKNSEKKIQNSLNSFFKQNYNNKELIIVDGLSEDKTVEKIKIFEHKISKIIVEKDNGIYDALNKGIKVAKGEIFGILHSDDNFYNDEVLTKVMEQFNKKNYLLIHTNVHIKYNHFKRKYSSSDTFNLSDFSEGRMPPHTGIFFDKKILDFIGTFDINFKFASDFDFIIRCFKKIPKERIFYLNLLSIEMKSGGKSTRNIINIIKQNLECLQILKKNDINYNTVNFIVKKIINRLNQII